MVQYWETGETYKEGPYYVICVSPEGYFYSPELGGCSYDREFFSPHKVDDFSVGQLAHEWGVSINYVDVLLQSFFHRGVPQSALKYADEATVELDLDDLDYDLDANKPFTGKVDPLEVNGSWLLTILQLEYEEMEERRILPLFC